MSRRYIAFLRAINVGGRTVTMSRLREAFESMGFANVETFIASGNVIFESRAPRGPALIRRIESRLEVACGFDVTAVLRTDRELAAIVAHDPFPGMPIPSEKALNVALLAKPASARAKRALLLRATEADRFHVRGPNVYWLCRTRQSESKFSNAVLEKQLGVKSTLRGIGMLRRLTAKYGP